MRRTNENKYNFKLNFISDRLSQQLNQIVKKYEFPLCIINKPAKNLQQTLRINSNKTEKHENCNICDHLPEGFTCCDKFIVFKFACNRCNRFYIGETSPPFSYRYKEHNRSNKDLKRALSPDDRSQAPMTLTNFGLEVIARCSTPEETRLTEARAISTHKDLINCKHERL